MPFYSLLEEPLNPDENFLLEVSAFNNGCKKYDSKFTDVGANGNRTI